MSMEGHIYQGMIDDIHDLLKRQAYLKAKEVENKYIESYYTYLNTTCSAEDEYEKTRLRVSISRMDTDLLDDMLPKEYKDELRKNRSKLIKRLDELTFSEYM